MPDCVDISCEAFLQLDARRVYLNEDKNSLRLGMDFDARKVFDASKLNLASYYNPFFPLTLIPLLLYRQASH